MSQRPDDGAGRSRRLWKPAPERFSVAERMALSHSEGHCYRMRLDRLMAETGPELEPDDAQTYLDLYRGADPQGCLRSQTSPRWA